MENLHSANGMLYGDADFRMLPVMFYLCGGQFWFWVIFRFLRPFIGQVYFGFRAILFVCSLEPKVQPYIRLMEPLKLGVKYFFHEFVIVAAPSEETEDEKDLSVQARDDDRLDRVAFFFPL